MKLKFVLAIHVLMIGVIHAEVIQSYNIYSAGGNSYYEGNASSFGGNLGLEITPAIVFNEKRALLPYYSGDYQGIKSFVRLPEGGSLYQQTQDHLFSLKMLYKKSEYFKFKTKIG